MKPLAPVHIGRYRVVAILGEGGMGRVLLGLSPDGRLAAVKQIRPDLAQDPTFRSRFRREVDASRRVAGAYTAAVLDADPEAPAPWLASVFVNGPTLGDAVPLPPESIRYLAAGLASALIEIHRAGLIHRDLKPGNVILTDDGPRVIDFGIARAAVGASELTHTGSVIGSPGFMSPEQAEGRQLTPASDVFSLGSLLVMAATGHSPFAGASTPQTLYNIVHQQPDLRMVPFADLAAACLAKDPARRPTPEQILAHLGQIPPTARPWPPAVHAAVADQRAAVAAALKPRRRRTGPLMAVAAGTVVVAAAATIVGLTLSGDEATTPNTTIAAPPPPTSTTQPNPDPLATPNLRRTDPCKVLDGRHVEPGGQLKAKPTSRFARCGLELPDGITVDLGLGYQQVSNDSPGPPEQVEGRPLIMRGVDGNKTCQAMTPTVDVPSLGISATVGFEHRKPEAACKTARSMLAEAIRVIRSGSAAGHLPQGTLQTTDPCALPDPATTARLFGTATTSGPNKLHECKWQFAGPLSVSLDTGIDPGREDESQPVQVAGITAYQQVDEVSPGNGGCRLAWAHRPFDDSWVEIVALSYDGAGTGVPPQTICQNLRDLAATIIPKLPKP
ncbi:serine/threonine-protein kinase [Amycolatopsis suaedae]|uniref:Serine/threonine protein kinase n=1 Tax=Amycolatopsis suaedae TaxID=2510978 RepID=A0A4Q7JFD0_9PSEU|nr:serine/threonine-protein kinase [Amycolatopsis suaedae]RZQ65254.1 serine/threonine protein kinase [Amycolatopsis suaedae]